MSPAKGQLRTIEPVESEGAEDSARGRRRDILKCTYRPPDANFFCWKYGVWYNLLDCCYRHFRRTYSGCADCGQGASNLRANKDRFHSTGHLGDRSRIGR
jgi:hypothetical protein